MNMRTKGQGIAPPHHFLCAACHKPKPTLGRKVRCILGVRGYVCVGCAVKRKVMA